MMATALFSKMGIAQQWMRLRSLSQYIVSYLKYEAEGMQFSVIFF
jgi:hypothetical protein